MRYFFEIALTFSRMISIIKIVFREESHVSVAQLDRATPF